MSVYSRLVRPLLFHCEPEWIHDRTLTLAQRVGESDCGRRILRMLYGTQSERLATKIGGLEFSHPVGLAAGFDKNGRGVRALAAIGFSHVEIGSVSADASSGNARPRLFRLPQDKAIVVNYGVPNDGARVIAARLSDTPIEVPLGVNLVETNTGRPTNEDEIVAEYLRAAGAFIGIADYLTLNLNCPNTTGGVSPFHDMGRVGALLQGLAEVPTGQIPILLKFTAHQDEQQADDLLGCVDSHPQVAGFIFNLPPGKNYTLSTPAHLVDPLPGTLCGAPTRQMMDATLAFWAARIDRSRLALVGSGGITDAEDAYRKIRLGASLLQLYTALIYAGPGIIHTICEGLLQRLDRDGFDQLTDAIGVDVPVPT